GSTVDLDKRLYEHHCGFGANYTRKRLPVKLLYYEEYDRIDYAFFREKQVQGWSRKKKEALMNGEDNDLHLLAECKNWSHSKNRHFGSAQ
ncbi:MAG: GIY-YIG nuclease family protein, partial [bacterium]|nr:GIY-YIG nuclease family protein [bacterium]